MSSGVLGTVLLEPKKSWCKIFSEVVAGPSKIVRLFGHILAKFWSYLAPLCPDFTVIFLGRNKKQV